MCINSPALPPVPPESLVTIFLQFVTVSIWCEYTIFRISDLMEWYCRYGIVAVWRFHHLWFLYCRDYQQSKSIRASSSCFSVTLLYSTCVLQSVKGPIPSLVWSATEAWCYECLQSIWLRTDRRVCRPSRHEHLRIASVGGVHQMIWLVWHWNARLRIWVVCVFERKVISHIGLFSVQGCSDQTD